MDIDIAVDIIDGNLKLILGMIWTLILRFTIADIRCAITAFPVRLILMIMKVKKAFQRKRACCFGANAKLSRTKKSTFKTFLQVGQMVSPCTQFLDLYLAY